MDDLIDNNLNNLIAELLSKGIDYTRAQLTEILNCNIDEFNRFVKECNTGEFETRYMYDSYTIIELYVGDNSVTTDMLCINWKFSTTNNPYNELKYYNTTHGYIDLKNNSLKFFQFGPNTKVNKEHQRWLRRILPREYKLNQII